MQKVKPDIEQLPFFFIVGRPRSGTTLLRTLFDAHPNVAIPLECKFALDLYPRYGRIINWNRKDIDSFFHDLQDQLLLDTWKLDAGKLKADMEKCIGYTPYSTVCRKVYLHYQSFFEKEEILMIGDKNPGYTIYTRQLAKIFPGAKFIHIIRDYRDNYLSLKNVDFELPVPSLAATKWKLFYRKFNRDTSLDPGQYLVVRYEDLVQDPEKEMKSICSFLRLPFREEVLDFARKKEEVQNAYPEGFVEKYHANLLKKVNTSRMGLWKQKLSAKEIRSLDLAAGGDANDAGYKRQFKSFGVWARINAFPGIFLAYFLAFLTKFVDRMPYRLRINILNKWPLAVARLYARWFK